MDGEGPPPPIFTNAIQTQFEDGTSVKCTVKDKKIIWTFLTYNNRVYEKYGRKRLECTFRYNQEGYNAIITTTINAFVFAKHKQIIACSCYDEETQSLIPKKLFFDTKNSVPAIGTNNLTIKFNDNKKVIAQEGECIGEEISRKEVPAMLINSVDTKSNSELKKYIRNNDDH